LQSSLAACSGKAEQCTRLIALRVLELRRERPELRRERLHTKCACYLVWKLAQTGKNILGNAS
ncbi:MAG: hypothetical protein RR322_01450, partial [Oscillospiraceae bacterium]